MAVSPRRAQLSAYVKLHQTEPDIFHKIIDHSFFTFLDSEQTAADGAADGAAVAAKNEGSSATSIDTGTGKRHVNDRFVEQTRSASFDEFGRLERNTLSFFRITYAPQRFGPIAKRDRKYIPIVRLAVSIRSDVEQLTSQA